MKNLRGRRLAEALAAVAMLILAAALNFYIFPSQIPAGLDDDLSSGQYPLAILIVWVASALGWLSLVLFSKKSTSGDVEGGPPGIKSLYIGGTIVIAFILFSQLGFIVAAVPTIICLAYLCGERGIVPWVLGFVTPPAIYLFLLYVLEVRLPTILPL